MKVVECDEYGTKLPNPAFWEKLEKITSLQKYEQKSLVVVTMEEAVVKSKLFHISSDG